MRNEVDTSLTKDRLGIVSVIITASEIILNTIIPDKYYHSITRAPH